MFSFSSVGGKCRMSKADFHFLFLRHPPSLRPLKFNPFRAFLSLRNRFSCSNITRDSTLCSSVYLPLSQTTYSTAKFGQVSCLPCQMIVAAKWWQGGAEGQPRRGQLSKEEWHRYVYNIILNRVPRVLALVGVDGEKSGTIKHLTGCCHRKKEISAHPFGGAVRQAKRRHRAANNVS